MNHYDRAGLTATTPKTVVKHLRALADWLNSAALQDKEDASLWLNDYLDDLHVCDVFGTEGQNDPRGDSRS